MIRINLLTPVRMRLAPIDNDERFIFTNLQNFRAMSFWSFHKEMLRVKSDWQLEVARDWHSEKASAPKETVNTLINDFGAYIQRQLAAKLIEADALIVSSGNKDVLSMRQNALSPHVFSAYLKAQLRDSVRGFDNKFNISDLHSLFARIENLLW